LTGEEVPTLKQPSCIHVPALRRGRAARIVWADIKDSVQYVLQRRLAYTVPVSSALNWGRIDGAEVTWDMVSQRCLPWRQIDVLCSRGCIVYLWDLIDAENITWNIVSDFQYSWEEIQAILDPTAHGGEDSGFLEDFTTICDGDHFTMARAVYDWGKIDGSEIAWDVVSQHSLPWEKINALCSGELYSEFTEHNAYDWGIIDAASITWDKATDCQYPWGTIQSILGPIAHVAFDEYIPEEVSLAEYRLIIHYANGESEILSSGVLPVLGDDFEDVTSRIVSAGDLAYYQINAKGAPAMDKLLYIDYNHEELEPKDYYSGFLSPVSTEDGALVFRMTKDLSEELEWSGLVVVLKFIALISGEAQVHMETKDVQYPR